MTPRRLAGALAGFLLAGFSVLAAAPDALPAPLPQVATCSGVWVVVDYGELGGISTSCATSYGTGTKALRSAGFSPTLDNGMVLKIKGKPSKPDIYSSYWSYWQAERKSDGSYGSWSYSNKGANSSKPAKGNAEGWRYQSLSEGKVAPGAKPPAAEPEPEPTTAKPTATKKPSAKPSKPATASATASSTPTSASASPTREPSQTSADVSTSPGVTAEAQAQASAEVSASVDEDASPTSSGSPTGLLVAGGLAVLGIAGATGWWLLKGRRR